MKEKGEEAYSECHKIRLTCPFSQGGGDRAVKREGERKKREEEERERRERRREREYPTSVGVFFVARKEETAR